MGRDGNIKKAKLKSMQKVNINCSTCALLKNGRLCREMGILINERDLKGNLKCKYYKDANDKENSKKAMAKG